MIKIEIGIESSKFYANLNHNPLKPNYADKKECFCSDLLLNQVIVEEKSKKRKIWKASKEGAIVSHYLRIKILLTVAICSAPSQLDERLTEQMKKQNYMDRERQSNILPQNN